MSVLLRITCGLVGATVFGLCLMFSKLIENTYLRIACITVCFTVYILGMRLAFGKRNRDESNHQVDNS